MTEKLFWKDSYQQEFNASVVDQFPVEDGYAVVLDRTCFYATSGGQPNDLGSLESIRVKDVRIEGDRLLHILEAPLTIPRVKGTIDWQRRFDHMQQHSGQHILSAAFFRLYDAETSSFHLGENDCSIELNKPRLKEEDIHRAEDLANEMICSSVDVEAFFVDPEKAEDYPLRKKSDLTEALRIIRISDFDLSPCSGTHVRNSGEVGIICVTGLEKISQGVKIYFLCGQRVRHRYRKDLGILKSLSAEMTTSVELLPESISRLRSQMKDLRKELKRFQEKELLKEVEILCAHAESVENGNRVIAVWDRPYSEVRFVAQRMTEQSSIYGAIASIPDCRVAFFKGRELNYDLKSVFQEFISTASAKGGGPPHLMEAGGFASELELEPLLRGLEW